MIVWIVRRWCPVAEAVQADCSTALARWWQNSSHRSGCMISWPSTFICQQTAEDGTLTYIVNVCRWRRWWCRRWPQRTSTTHKNPTPKTGDFTGPRVTSTLVELSCWHPTPSMTALMRSSGVCWHHADSSVTRTVYLVPRSLNQKTFSVSMIVGTRRAYLDYLNYC